MLSWLPENISTYGRDIDGLFSLIVWVTTPWFLLMQGIILWSVLFNRRRVGRRAWYLRGDTWGQLAWILVPTAIILGLDFLIDARSALVWAHIKQRVPAGATEVRVTAKQFNWEFLYPGPDGRFGTEDDLTLDNELHVPVGQNVVFTLQSKDVIHSFFIPNVRLKQDVLPGRSIRGWFNAEKTGRYEIACAELCGISHYTMRAFLVVHTADEYRDWIEEKWPQAASAAAEPGTPTATELS